MNIYPALGWRNNADNWTVQGVQFLATSNSFPSQNYQVVFIRDDTNTDVSGFPRNAVLQHCLIRGEAAYGCLNGVRIMAHNVTIRDCTIDRIWNPSGNEGQAIEMLGGSNHLVENCYLEGATENIMIGGNPGYGDPAKRPEDITIRYCVFTKPTWMYSKSPDWNGTLYTVKNLFEVKGGRRILVEACDFFNFFEQHQAHPWTISTRRGYDSWMDIQDVTFRNCRLRNTGSILNTLAYDDLAYVPPNDIIQGRRLTVENCLFYNINNQYYGTGGGTPLFQLQFPYMTVKHCTWWKAPTAAVPGWSNIALHSGDGNVIPYAGFVFKDNIGMSGHYQVQCGPSSHGAWYYHFCSDALDGTRDWVCTNNVLANGTAAATPNYNGVWPANGNSFPSHSDLYSEFVDPENGNFRLKPGSPYKGTATDGQDPGVDMDQLEEALARIDNLDTTPPAVSITAPAAGATVSGASVSITAEASDNVGVAGVQFKLDGADLGAEVTSVPYNVSWNTTTTGNGPHTLTAVARDTAGNTTTSSEVSVTVSNSSGGGGTSGGGGGGGGCFIATAAYGSALEPRVVLLRTFRDRWLSRNAGGRAFVRWHGRVSPPLAARVEKSPALRRLVQGCLWPVIGAIRWILGP